MIALDNVSKRYLTDRIPGDWVLQGVSLTIPSRACVGVIGGKGSGKSTLLRLLAGTEEPTTGTVHRDARTVTPTTYSRSVQPLLTGRQNARFICRINGNVDDLEERLADIERLAGLGDKFDKPVSGYTPVQKSCLAFALSMAFDVDTYIADGYNFAGATAFRDKAAAESALRGLVERCGIIMSPPKGGGEEVLRQYCRSGIWLHGGKAEWFDDIDDAIEAERSTRPVRGAAEKPAQQTKAVSDGSSQLMGRIKQLSVAMRLIMAGLNGTPSTVSPKEAARLIQSASLVGVTLLTQDEIRQRGHILREGELPLLKMRAPGAGKEECLYGLETQCDKQELTA